MVLSPKMTSDPSEKTGQLHTYNITLLGDDIDGDEATCKREGADGSAEASMRNLHPFHRK
jgi:hypothetical protein